MPSAITNGARIRTNTAAENAYNALDSANRNIALRQLRLSTGKRINSAADDVAGYITVRSLGERNSSLKAALNAVGDAMNVTNIAQDGLDNITNLIMQIKEAVASAASGAMGTDEKIALAKAAYRFAQQIQTIVDSTVFAGRQLLDGTFTASFVIGSRADNTLITLGIDLSTFNPELNIPSNNFDLRLVSLNFAGVTGLSLASLNEVSSTDLGIFDFSVIQTTLTSISIALANVSKVASYLGGIANRLTSQEDALKSQITNYNAAISRIEDADVAKEQLELIRAQFLQQASILSLSQANQTPQTFLQLLRG
ncbi:MAG: flagellin [Bacteroidota bacterium]|nr:flagellin [Candidatus Kapabacteria bacterium]MCX7937311.1 flagellin [Chlorobiota bacterium]MDW8075573.1 flagellin [Bacteroidota bacterium]MDW8271748.1 flagellin [Bacteroidota bacterium]